jgi:hypothetical protein
MWKIIITIRICCIIEGKTETIWSGCFQRDYSSGEKKTQVSAAAARNGGSQSYCNVPISPSSGSYSSRSCVVLALFTNPSVSMIS